jgi:hypothetical protein
MVLPPKFLSVMQAIRYSTLSYLPNIYSVPDAVLRETVPGKIFDMLGDYSFLRNAGFALTPFAVILLAWSILKVLSIPEVNKNK